MALPDTSTLDIPSRGLPAEFIYSISSNKPVIDTTTLDIPSRGLPAAYLYTITAGSTAILVGYITLLGAGQL